MRYDFNLVVQRILLILSTLLIIVSIFSFAISLGKSGDVRSLFWNSALIPAGLIHSEIPRIAYILAAPIEIAISPIGALLLTITGMIFLYKRRSIFILFLICGFLTLFAYVTNFYSAGAFYIVLALLIAAFLFLSINRYFNPLLSEGLKSKMFLPLFSFFVVIFIFSYLFITTFVLGYYDFLMLHYALPKLSEMYKKENIVFILTAYDRDKNKYLMQDPNKKISIFNSLYIEVVPKEQNSTQSGYPGI